MGLLQFLQMLGPAQNPFQNHSINFPDALPPSRALAGPELKPEP